MSYLEHFASSPSTLATIGLLLLVSGLAAALALRRRLLVSSPAPPSRRSAG